MPAPASLCHCLVFPGAHTSSRPPSRDLPAYCSHMVSHNLSTQLYVVPPIAAPLRCHQLSCAATAAASCSQLHNNLTPVACGSLWLTTASCGIVADTLSLIFPPYLVAALLCPAPPLVPCPTPWPASSCPAIPLSCPSPSSRRPPAPRKCCGTLLMVMRRRWSSSTACEQHVVYVCQHCYPIRMSGWLCPCLWPLPSDSYPMFRSGTRSGLVVPLVCVFCAARCRQIISI